VQRGLERLRARLDREYGGRRDSWAAGLWTLLGRQPVRPLPWLALPAAAAFLGLSLGAWWLWRGAGPAERARPEPGRASAVTPAPAPVPGGLSAPAAGSARRGLALSVLPGASREDQALQPTTVFRALDLSGAGVGGLELQVTLEAGTSTFVTAPDGGFQVPLAPDEWPEVTCAEPGLLVLFQAPRGPERLVVLAPRASFAGEVVRAADGLPLQGARLSFRMQPELFAALGVQHPQLADPEAWHATSDAAGRFSLPQVAGGPHLALVAETTGYRPLELALPASGDPALRLALEPAWSATIHGLVLGQEGLPFEGARVSLGHEIVSSDADGLFTLGLGEGWGRWIEEPGEQRFEIGVVDLWARAPGHQPGHEVLRAGELPDEVVLQLGAGPSAIRGCVLDELGRPLPGVVVWPRALTGFGLEQAPGAEAYRARRLVVEELDGESDGTWYGALTDAAGRFVLAGLIDRRYDLRLLEAATASTTEIPGVLAGEAEVELVLRRGPTARVAGRVVSGTGAGRPGLTIRPQHGNAFERGPPQLVGGEFWVETDEQGCFEFPRLALEDTTLVVEGALVDSARVRLADCADLEAVEIVFPLYCELQVMLTSDPGLADSFALLDDAGHELELRERVHFGGNSIVFQMDSRVAITAGRSNVVEAPETARTLVLYAGSESTEVLRVPVVLAAGETTVVSR